MSDFTTYEVEVFVKGEPMYVVEVPTAQGEAAAISRAVTSVWAKLHPDLTLDDLHGCIYAAT